MRTPEEVTAAVEASTAQQITAARQEIGAVVRSFNDCVTRIRLMRGAGLLADGALTDDAFTGPNAGISAKDFLVAIEQVAALDTTADEQGISSALIRVMA